MNREGTNEFRLYNDIISLDDYLRQYISNEIPSIHRDLKINLLNESYNSMKSIVQAIYSKGNIREKALRDTLISITMMNILIDKIRQYCKNNKHIDKAIGMITNIKNMTLAWLNTEEKKKGKINE